MSDRIILPAPLDTSRENEIVWYEGQSDLASRSINLFGYASGRKAVSAAQVIFSDDNSTRGILIAAQMRVEVVLSFARDDSGNITIDGTVAGQPFQITGDVGVDMRDAPKARDSLSTDEGSLLRQWGRLSDSLNAIAEATRNSWGCGACLWVGAGGTIAAAACGGGALPSCATALIAMGTIWAQCQGACASAVREPEPIVLES